MRKLLPSGLAVLGLGMILMVPAGPASAHALLKTAEPPVGSTVAAGPKDLRLHFSEGVEAAFSGVEITADGNRSGTPVTVTVAPATVATDPADDATLVVTLPAPLAAGSYRIHWHVISVDTHKTEGNYTFTVSPQ